MTQVLDSSSVEDLCKSDECTRPDADPKFHLIVPTIQGLGFDTYHHDCAASGGLTPASIIVRHTDGAKGRELAARLADLEHPVHNHVFQHTLRQAATIHVNNHRVQGLALPTVAEVLEHFAVANPNPSDHFVDHVTNLVGLQASAIKQGRASNFLNAELGSGTYVARTGAIMLELDSAAGSQAAAGTAVTGGSYADQVCAFGTASVQTGTYSAQIANSGTPTFPGMPATTVQAIELKDSAGTPLRMQWGALTSNKTTNAGDTVSVAVGAITCQL